MHAYVEGREGTFHCYAGRVCTQERNTSLIELLPAYTLRQPHLNKTKRLKRQENKVITLNKGVPMALCRPGGESNS